MENIHKKAGFSLFELLVVMGIFTLIIGASFTLFSVGRLSFQENEAHIQVQEYARQAMERISRELYPSRPSHVYLSDNVDWNTNSNSGSVVNFQIPVGSYAASLVPHLTANFEIDWGSATTPGDHLAYSIDANSQLVRSTYTAVDGSGATTAITTPHIVSLTFSRSSAESPLIDIQIISQVDTDRGPLTHTLCSNIKLRN